MNPVETSEPSWYERHGLHLQHHLRIALASPHQSVPIVWHRRVLVQPVRRPARSVICQWPRLCDYSLSAELPFLLRPRQDCPNEPR